MITPFFFSPQLNQPSSPSHSNMTPPEQLLLTFNTIVNPNLCNAASLRLQNTLTSPTSNASFTGLTCALDTFSPFVVQVTVDRQEEWMTVQADTNLATMESNTFITLASGFTQDGSLIPNNPTTLQVTMFTPNVNPPMLQTGVVDIQTRLLGLVFSEGVNISTFDPTGISVSFTNDATGSRQAYTLTGGSFSTGDTGNQVIITLSFDDFSVVGSARPDPSDFLITLAANSVLDGNGMPNVLQENVSLLSFSADNMPPSIDSFILNLNTGMMSLSFSEAILVNATDYSLIILESGNNGSTPYSLTGSMLVRESTFQRTVIDIQLPPQVLSAIIGDVSLCTSASNCFISWRNDSFRDVSNNPALEPRFLFQVANLLPDTTSPELLSFGIDLSNGVLNLTFSEPVDGSVFNLSAVMLTDGVNQQAALSGVILVGGSGFSVELSIVLSVTALNFAKTLLTVRLAVLSTTTIDSAGNPLVQISVANSILPDILIPDTVLPTLLTFAPQDPSTRRISLRFDEPVDTTRWNGNQLTLTLRISTGDFNYTSFTLGTLSPEISDQIVYEFSSTEYTLMFAAQYTEAFNNGSILLLANEGLIEDLAGNRLLGLLEALTFSTQPPDTIPPSLVNFDLDMDAGWVSMTFSEPVYFLTPNFTLIRLVNNSEVYALTGGVLVSGPGPFPVVEMILADSDLNGIKFNRQICTGPQDCFMVVSSGLVEDRAGNGIESTVASPILITTYTPDTTPPVLDSLLVDWNAGMLEIRFSEPVLTDMSSIDLASFVLSSSASSQSGIGLNSSVITEITSFSSRLTVSLAMQVEFAIKLDRSVCTEIADCFLRWPAGSFRDTTENVAASGIGLQPLSFIQDSVSPQIVSFNLNLHTGVMVFTFSEPVMLATFNPTGFTLLATPPGSMSSESYAYSGGFLLRVLDDYSAVIELSLAQAALNQIKLLNTINPGRIFIAATSFTATDVEANPLIPIPSVSPLFVNIFTADATPPELTNFAPALSNITFIFSEFVNGSDFREGQFTLRLMTAQGTSEYSGFSGGVISSDILTDMLTYTFSQSDFNATFMARYSEAITRGSVSLTVGTALVSDLNGNVLVTPGGPLFFSTDTIRPTLLNFTLDLNQGLLDLSFSEAVSILFVANRAHLQNSAENPTFLFTLTQNGTLIPASTASENVVVMLDSTDLNNIKILPDLGNSIQDTFLSLEEGFATDLSGNLLSPGPSALQAASIIPDNSRPLLVSASLDLNQGSMVLSFSETVSTSSLNASLIYLTGVQQNESSGYDLSNSIHSEQTYTDSIMLALSLNLLNKIKFDEQVCTSRSNCIVFIADGAVRDVSGNLVVPSEIGTVVLTLIPDTTSPRLLSYVMDLDSGTVTLTFPEPILAQVFNPAGISALAGQNTTEFGDVSITDVQSLGTVFTLATGSVLLNQLKVLSSIGPVSIYLDSSTASDTSGNIVVPIPSSNPLTPQTFTPDTTPPSLSQFIPSSDASEFSLVFDEYVDPGSITTNLLSFTLKNRNGQLVYADLSNASVSATLFDTVILTLPDSETRFTDSSFLELFALSFNEGSICLNLVPSFVTDLSGNAYSGELLAVYLNHSDTERPQLVSFALNLNTSSLSMTFSEDVSVFRPEGNVRLQNRVTSPTASYSLAGASIVSGQDTPLDVVVLSISQSDLLGITNLPSLASSINDTYLLLLETFAVDLSGNLLVDTTEAIQASRVTQVIQRPTIVSFDLDLDSDIMTLEFDRGVNVSTFDSSRITLTNVSSTSETQRVDVRLNGGELLTPPGSIVQMFRFLLRANDSIDIKRHPLCFTPSNCYGSFESGLIFDATGNFTSKAVLRVDMLLTDVTPPRLVAFTVFDLDQGSFTLIFNEPVNGSSARVTDIEYSDRITNPSATVTLRESVVTRNNIVINFILSPRDLNALKVIPGLCTSRDNCWVRLPSFFIDDFGMNPFLHSSIIPDAQASFHQPLTFIVDTTRPALAAFDVDLNAGNMTLSFTEVIQESTFYPENVTLLNGPSGSAMIVLSSETSFTRSASGDEVMLTFTTSDLNSIKSATDLFTNVSNSFLAITGGFLLDSSGNSLLSVPLSSPRQASMYIEDTTSPIITSFDLFNNENGSFAISFNEPIDVSSIHLSRFTLLSGPSTNTSDLSYTLVGGLITYVRPDELSLVATLLSMDLREVKLRTGLATSMDNVYLSVTSDALTDRNGNNVVEILPTSPLQLRVGGFVSDSSRASLSDYTFDMNTATISLTFTDVLDISTLDPRQLTVQNSRTTPSAAYTLTGGSTPSENSHIFVIDFSTQDIAALQSDLTLATAFPNTFISFNSLFIRDINGLEVVAVPSSAAQQPALYLPDQVRPRMESFSLDMNTGMLALSFSEVMLVNTIQLTSILIQNAVQAPDITSYYRLTGGTFTSPSDPSLTLQITFTDSDLNEIKRLTDLATSSSDTFLSVVADLIRDTNSNKVEEMFFSVGTYIPDTTPPVLLTFDLTITSVGVLSLQFSEAINYSSSVQTTIQLQNNPSTTSVSKMLSAEDVVSTLSSLHTVEILLQPTSLVFLLNNPNIATSTSTLYMSLASSGGFVDYAGNEVVGISSTQAMPVRFICEYKTQ